MAVLVADIRGTKSFVLERAPEMVCASLTIVPSYRLLHGEQVVLQVVYEYTGLYDSGTDMVKQAGFKENE